VSDSAEVIPLVQAARADLERRRHDSRCKHLFAILDGVKDPEIPVLSIWDLGILQDVRESEAGIEVTITPTYSGCPAIDEIKRLVVDAMSEHGHSSVQVRTQLAPSWTTDWMSVQGRRQLRAYGVAEPHNPACPQCESRDVAEVSEYGSTSCKALYTCKACREPFDYFRPH